MPKSFLVKTASRSKRRLEEELCEDNDELSAAAAVQRAEDLESNSTDDVGIQCNLETSVDFCLQRPHDNGHQTPHFPVLDTRGLHTLAELCLRRADYESSKIIEKVANCKPERETPVSTASDGFKEPRELRESKAAIHDKDSIGLRTKVAKIEDDDDDDDGGDGDDNNDPEVEKREHLIQRNKIITRTSTNTDESNGSRLEKLEEELEKMLQGKEEIIGREIREFMENNKVLEEELTEETSVSQVEISKYLLEGVHLKDDKRKKLFRWYLEKKLSRMDSDDESFTCYKCGKIFAYESYLERHVKYVCPDKTGRTWKCSYCSKAFQYPCYLRRHMRSHTGESPYKCSQCSRAFVRSTDLQRHLRNHTGEKPYKCQECSRAFARSTDLKRHMRTHTGEKPYKCWQCSKAFSQSGSLQTHLHTHYKESLQIKGSVADKIKRT